MQPAWYSPNNIPLVVQALKQTRKWRKEAICCLLCLIVVPSTFPFRCSVCVFNSDTNGAYIYVFSPGLCSWIGLYIDHLLSCIFQFGRTEVIDNTLNPDFVRKFILDYFFEERQNLRFDLWVYHAVWCVRVCRAGVCKTAALRRANLFSDWNIHGLRRGRCKSSLQ